MICSVCAIGLHYLILKFLSVNLFLWGHELANSFFLFSGHKSFLQIIKKISLRHRLHLAWVALGKNRNYFRIFLSTLLKCDPVLRVPEKFRKFHKMSKKIKDAVVYGWGTVNF